jgi:hypothetical protein
MNRLVHFLRDRWYRLACPDPLWPNCPDCRWPIMENPRCERCRGVKAPLCDRASEDDLFMSPEQCAQVLHAAVYGCRPATRPESS